MKFVFLLADGRITPWYADRHAVDHEQYRDVWHKLSPVVAILRCREKPEWLRRLWTLPCDGLWHPVEVAPGEWQAIRGTRVAETTSYAYDYIVLLNYEQRQRVPNVYKRQTACDLRCLSLNGGRGQPGDVRDMRNSFSGRDVE